MQLGKLGDGWVIAKRVRLSMVEGQAVQFAFGRCEVSEGLGNGVGASSVGVLVRVLVGEGVEVAVVVAVGVACGAQAASHPASMRPASTHRFRHGQLKSLAQ